MPKMSWLQWQNLVSNCIWDSFSRRFSSARYWVQTESLSSPATPSSPQICSYWAPIAHPCHDLPNCCALTPLAFSPSASRLQFSCCHLPASLRIHPTAADPESGRHHLVQFLQSLLLTSLLLLDTSSSVFSLHCS